MSEIGKAKKTAVVLFNLGGPDSLPSIKPFLFNLFYDPFIIRLPNPFRYFLAKLISGRREKEAQEIYTQIGGRSPIVANTKAQAEALEKELGKGYKTFVCMRHWHPMTEEVVGQVKAYNPDEIILLPLYPQYSTTTTKSSFLEWHKASDLPAKVHEICCYPTHSGFVDQVILQLKWIMKDLKRPEQTRFLFSAHGLPEKVIRDGDPYQDQIEKTTQAVLSQTGVSDAVICYQSRVGPLKWIGPSTDDEIKRAGQEDKDVVLIPISFVSEHSETLVELDIEYKELATLHGVQNYIRVPTVDDREIFIKGLKNLVLEAQGKQEATYDYRCDACYGDCWRNEHA